MRFLVFIIGFGFGLTDDRIVSFCSRWQHSSCDECVQCVIQGKWNSFISQKMFKVVSHEEMYSLFSRNSCPGQHQCRRLQLLRFGRGFPLQWRIHPCHALNPSWANISLAHSTSFRMSLSMKAWIEINICLLFHCVIAGEWINRDRSLLSHLALHRPPMYPLRHHFLLFIWKSPNDS